MKKNWCCEDEVTFEWKYWMTLHAIWIELNLNTLKGISGEENNENLFVNMVLEQPIYFKNIEWMFSIEQKMNYGVWTLLINDKLS
jgi:hypothetical protein